MKPTVIFDFDGTLANSIELVFRIYNEIAPQYRADKITHEELPMLRKLGYTKAAKAKRIRWTILPRLVMHVSREMRSHINEVQPYEGIVPLISKLKEDGFTVGVLTSNQEALVREFFDTHHFAAFDFVVAEKTMFGKDKALRKILKKYPIDPQRVVYVGDEPRDVAACRRIGMPVIGVTWGVAGSDGFGVDEPDVRVDTPEQLHSELLRYS